MNTVILVRFVTESTKTTEDRHLHRAFKQYGKIKDINLDSSLKFAFLQFEDFKGAQAAVYRWGNQTINKAEVKVQFSSRPTARIATPAVRSAEGEGSVEEESEESEEVEESEESEESEEDEESEESEESEEDAEVEESEEDEESDGSEEDSELETGRGRKRKGSPSRTVGYSITSRSDLDSESSSEEGFTSRFVGVFLPPGSPSRARTNWNYKVRLPPGGSKRNNASV